MKVQIYHRYGENKPGEAETRICQINELGAELMSIFLLYDRQPLWLIFRKGEEQAECVVIVQRKERRGI